MLPRAIGRSSDRFWVRQKAAYVTLPIFKKRYFVREGRMRRTDTKMPKEIIEESYYTAREDYLGNIPGLLLKLGRLQQEAEEFYERSLLPRGRRAWSWYCDIKSDIAIIEAVEAEMHGELERRNSALERALLYFRLAEMDDTNDDRPSPQGTDEESTVRSEPQNYLN